MRFRYPYPKADGTVGHRRPRHRPDWPQWYTIDRVQPSELLGSLHAERVRCGKEGCRCRSGAADDRHGPYWYRRWRDDEGRQRKTYVKQGDLAEVRARIEHRRRRLAEEREARKKHMWRRE